MPAQPDAANAAALDDAANAALDVQLAAAEPSIFTDAVVDARLSPQNDAEADADGPSMALPDAGFSTETACLQLYPSTAEPVGDCPARSCMPAHSTFVAASGELVCPGDSGCKLPSDPTKVGAIPGGGFYTQGYRYVQGNIEIWLTFNNEVLRGYSLENFRRYISDGQARVPVAVDGVSESVVAFGKRVDLLSYDDGLLHFRITGEVTSRDGSVEVLPYYCTIGHLPTLCTSAPCRYQPNVQENARVPDVVFEGVLRIEQPTP